MPSAVLSSSKFSTPFVILWKGASLPTYSFATASTADLIFGLMAARCSSFPRAATDF